MKKSMQERLNDFLDRNKLSIQSIQEMIRSYAYSDKELARSHFSKEYGISYSVFYKCRDFAIICWLVDDFTCDKLRAKAIENYRSHNPKGTATASIAFFDELFSKRKDYLNSVSDEVILEIAESYAQGKSSGELAYEYSKSDSFIVEVITRGIREMLIDKKTVDRIVVNVPNSYSYSLESAIIGNAIMDRDETKKNILRFQRGEILTLKFKISNYDLFFKFDDVKPEISELQKQLIEAQERFMKTQENL